MAQKETSDVAEVFEALPEMFQKGTVTTPRTIYYSLDEDEKWTVAIAKDKCTVTPGKPEKDADCFFKASKKMFLDVWNGKYKPGPMDFMSGKIKSNNPMLLKDFIAAFRK